MPTTANQPQHLQALERANQVRLERADLKRKILDNERVLQRTLEDPPECVFSAPISELLKAQRRWGSTRSHKFLANLGINDNRKVEDLTNRQREAICEALERVRVKRERF